MKLGYSPSCAGLLAGRARIRVAGIAAAVVLVAASIVLAGHAGAGPELLPMPQEDAGIRAAYLDGAAGTPKVTVLNPQSHPLVNGIWSVDLEVTGGSGTGDLTVNAVDGTEFGRDIEFYGMEGSRDSLTPSGRNPLVFYGVADGKWNFAVRVLTDGPHHLEFGLGDGTASASNTASFANVTSNTPDGTYGPGETIDIRIGFTEPVTLERFGIRDGGSDGAGGTFDELNEAISIATAQIVDKHYALVTAQTDDGVQIIDITDPASPRAVASFDDGDSDGAGGTFDVLDETTSIATAQIGDYHYALVTSENEDGVQIINITDPASPRAVASITEDSSDGDGGTFDELDWPESVTTAQIGDYHYALVASQGDHGVQIINMTNPASPKAVASLADGAEYELEGASSVTTTKIGDYHYALVASYVLTFTFDPVAGQFVVGSPGAVQIINITNPASPSPVASVNENEAYPELSGAESITTAQIGDYHYALVAARYDDGVQIINITNPASPTAVASFDDGDSDGAGGTFDELDEPVTVTTTQIGDSHYALVASYEDSGVQIINITDPASPTAVGSFEDGTTYPDLWGASSVTTAEIGDNHYALVSSENDDGVQIIDITDPENPFNPLPLPAPYLELDLSGGDGRAAYTGLGNDDTALFFNYTVQDGDYARDLAYAGAGALHLDGGIIRDVDAISNVALPAHGLSSVPLPAPGQPNSLSHNKDIAISDTDAFVTTWRTTSDGDNTITLPIQGSGMTVHWGDGQNDTGVSVPTLHRYASAGDHIVTVTGDLTQFRLGAGDDASKLISIDQWGTAEWASMEHAFQGAYSMGYNATDSPDLSRVTNMSSMFNGAAVFNGDISSWSVSNVEDMNYMFAEASAFDQPLDSWTVSSVTDMSNMFRAASAFNQPLNLWDVSKVADMRSMFEDAAAFNGDISSWTVSNVKDTSRMFFGATPFNQTLDSWTVSSVTDMDSMFNGASAFNGNISSWKVSNVEDMSSMFDGASAFNQPIGDWDVSKVAEMTGMFRGASAFNQPIGDWTVSSVTYMHNMFRGASAFNQPIGDWTVSSVTDMHDMFRDASAFNQPIGEWNVSSVGTMRSMFSDASAFNQPIGEWNVSSVGTMRNMFSGASAFNQPIGDWDVSKVDDMSNMFNDADAFSQNLGRWYVVPDDTSYGISEGTLDVTAVSAQNSVLGGHSPAYGIGAGGNSALFQMAGSTLMFRNEPSTGTYEVSVTASGRDTFGTNNHRMLEIIVISGNSPVARAGIDQTITARPLSGVTVTLDGSASFDPNDKDITFLWEQTPESTVSLTADGAIATFTPSTASDIPLAFMLTVTNDRNDDENTGTDSVLIHVPPQTLDATTITTADSITNSRTVTFTIDFDTEIDRDTLVVAVTGGATVDGIAPTFDSDTYTVTVSGLSEGRQTLSIPAREVKTFEGDVFAAASASVTVDLTDPTISSARVSGSDGIVASFSEQVAGTDAGTWTLVGEGINEALTINSSTGNSVTLSLSNSVILDDKPALDLRYVGSGIKDIAGNPLASNSERSVSYPSSGKSQESSVPVLDIHSVIASYAQSVPKEIQDAATQHDPDSPIPPMTISGTFGFPLEINGYGYLLGGARNTLEPQAVRAGENVTISFTVYDSAPIAHFTLYMRHNP